MKREYFIIPVLCLAFFTFAAYGTRKPRNAFSMVNSEEMGNGVDRNVDTKKMDKGNPAPDFEVMDLSGNTVKLSDFAGKKVCTKYWVSWCPICLGELEDTNTFSAEDNGLEVLTIVAPGSKGERSDEDFKAWLVGTEHTKNITVLLDIDGVYTNRTGVQGFPISEYIGSDGVLIGLVPGHADNETIKGTFKAIN